MANKSIFSTVRGKLLPAARGKNRSGAPAYAYDARHKLAQLAVTGTLNDTFYAGAEAQLADALALAERVDAEFVAKAAIYARGKGHMKDMPALLLAVLSAKDPALFAQAFARVIDNGKMLRGFVQVMRSGATGRKSLGSRPKAMVAGWLNTASDQAILRASVGQDPSLADVIKMVHPKPKDPAREALFAWLIGKPCDVAMLPQPVQNFIRFKQTGEGELPDVPFQMLTALDLTAAQWADIARRGGWQMVRMNLNTFARHGVFDEPGVTAELAARLTDAEAIKRARAFPYQLMVAYAMAGGDVPNELREALQDAMEIATRNVPRINGKVVVCPDVSGSMTMPATGYRKGSSSAVRCIDVAALVAAAIQRKNRDARVMPFECDVVQVHLNPRDSVLTNAAKLAGIGGGGTNCSAPLAKLNKARAKVDMVILVSDNESWVDASRYGSTATLREWETLKRRCPKAKLVCIDIAPYGTTQAKEREDIMNVGGFSDAVFETIATFAKGKMSADHWVGEIEGVEL